MARKKKQYEDDDGRVIAPMNLDGMPWQDGLRRRRKHREEGGPPPDGELPEMTRQETRGVVWMALIAALAVAGIFLLAALIFILFCTNIWFK